MWKTSGPSFRDTEALIWCAHGDVGKPFAFCVSRLKNKSQFLCISGESFLGLLQTHTHTQTQTKSLLIGLGQLLVLIHQPLRLSFDKRTANGIDCLWPVSAIAEGRRTPDRAGSCSLPEPNVCWWQRPPSPLWFGCSGPRPRKPSMSVSLHPCTPPSTDPDKATCFCSRVCSVRVVSLGFPSHWIIGNN